MNKNFLLKCKQSVLCVYVGVSCVEIKTEADSNDINEWSQDDKPSTGMFAVSHGIASV